MHDTQDRAKAYSFDLHDVQAPGIFRAGWRKIRVAVTHFSWSGYSIVVPRSVSRILKPGRNGTLEFQGTRYEVVCADHIPQADGSVEVELERLEDAAKPAHSKKKRNCLTGASIRLNQRDPVLGVASWICLLMILLILPGWGEHWGTSNYLSEGFRSIVLNSLGACRCLLGK